MRAVLALEIFQDDLYERLRLLKHTIPQPEYNLLVYGADGQGVNKTRPWVAQITGLDKRYGFTRKFLHGQKDYSKANSIGSRGVYEYFALRPGIYEVQKRLSWKRCRRYFIRVDENGTITEVTREEVLQCLTSDS